MFQIILLIFIFSGQLFSDPLLVYLRERPNNPNEQFVLGWKNSEWMDLNGDLLFRNLISDHMRLTSGMAEFMYLLQPISNIQKLEDRRKIILEIDSQFEPLDAAVADLVDDEDGLIKILEKSAQKPEKPISKLLINGAIISAASVYGTKMTVSRMRHDFSVRNWPYLLMTLLSLPLSLYHATQEVLDVVTQAKSGMEKCSRDVYKLSLAIKKLKNIKKIVEQSSILSVVFSPIIGFEDLALIDPQFEKLLTDIDSGSYWPSGNESIFERALNYKEVFQTVLSSLGRLDAYLTVIRIYRDRLRKGLPVTWATFDQKAKKPTFKFKNLGNPLLPDSVPNDFALSGHAIFNGPSTCGKSAAMKSIAWAHILGQSILLVPAEEAHFAIVEQFRTYFNIGDNIASGKSSFKAQNLAMKKLESGLSQKTLLLVDEPYKGVPGKIGENLVVDFIERVIKNENSSLLLSTHYERPCYLGSEFQYFQPELIEDNGFFKRTYRMLPGVAAWWFENQNRKSDAFIQQIFQEN